MELRQIKDLMAAMRRHRMKRLVFEKDGLKLELEQEGEKQITASSSESELRQEEWKGELPASPPIHLRQMDSVPAAASSLEAAVPKKAQDEKSDAHLSYVTSPIIGTYYAAPSPENPAFVKVGDRVDKDTIVGIVEAMKVMNEIKAGVNGIIEECLIENGHPVDFGTKLFSVAPQ